MLTSPVQNLTQKFTRTSKDSYPYITLESVPFNIYYKFPLTPWSRYLKTFL